MIKSIGECFYQIQNGANIKQGEVDGGFPITRIETTANDKFNRDRMGYAGIADITQYESYVLEDGDLLMSHINSVQYLGRTVLYVKRPNETIIHGMNLLRLKANKDVIDPAYAKYYFNGHLFRSELGKITKKSVNQASFTVKDLKKIKIIIPPMSEQERIVFILDKIKIIIDNYQKQLEKYDELIKARFVEMFGDPNCNKNNLVKISDIGLLMSGGTPPRKEVNYFNGEIRWYSAGELNSLYLGDSIEHISSKAIEESSAKLFKKSTLMIGMYDTAAFKMGILTEESSSNQACANLQPSDRYNVIWLYYLFDIMKPKFLNERQGVRQKNLSLSKIKGFMVPYSETELQNQFADFVKQIDKSKFVEEKNLIIMCKIKRSLYYDQF